MVKPKTMRVWVAVVAGRPVEIAVTKACLEAGLQNNQWPRGDYLTIRRATLTLDPVKPKKRTVPKPKKRPRRMSKERLASLNNQVMQ